MAQLPRHGTIRGRGPELAAIHEALSALDRGTGCVVVVEGAAGIGKSRLLAEATSAAAARGASVGSAAAEPTDQVAELSSLLAALDGGRPPILDPAGLDRLRAQPEQRFWTIRDLQSELERAALRTPLAICIDDLQWVDRGTAAALRALPAEVSGLPIAWLLGIRRPPDTESVTVLLTQLRAIEAVTLALRPLDRSASERVVADVLGAAPDDGLAGLVEQAGGNPFLLVELLRGLLEEDQVVIEAGRARLIGRQLPARVRTSLRDRLARLSTTARHAVIVAASLGHSFAFADLARTLGWAPAALLGPCEELLSAELLLERGGELGFWHDLTREAIRVAVPASIRRALDRQAARALLEAGALPLEVANQVADSAEAGDEEAVTTLLEACRVLAATDPVLTARFGRRALELAPSGHPVRGELVTLTAIALHVAGDGREAIAFTDAALREVLPAEQEAEVRLGIASMFAISPDTRVTAGRVAVALPDISAPLRARHLAALVHNLFTAGRVDEADTARIEARTAVAATGDRRAEFILLEGESGVEYALGHFERARELITAAARKGPDAGDDQRLRLVRMWHGEILSVLDRYDDAFAIAVDGAAEGRRHRQAWAYQMFDAWRARMSAQTGHLADAVATLEGRFHLEDGSGVVAALEAAGITALGRAVLATGDARQVRRLRSVAQVMLGHESPVVIGHAAWLLALLAQSDGDPHEAARLVRRSARPGRRSVLPRIPADVLDEVDLARIGLAAGAEDLMQEAITLSEDRARDNPRAGTIRAAALHVRGLVHADPEALERAVEILRGGPRPPAAAAALEDLGVQRGPTERDQAIARFSDALALYAAAGAVRDARRVRGRLRELGIRRRLTSAESARSGWEALTRSERAVAELVAEGLTNREAADRLYVSPHTVNSHLRHVFAKLGISSRVELARVARLDGQPS
jgi:DNA-binding CsgD family transcriptional regulator